MGRYREAVCRLCKREGKKLFLKGARCDTDKCPMEREGRSGPPGELPKRGVKRASGYRIHLREKQKSKRVYGISEHQFRRYYELAVRKKGITGEILLQTLERRLDNVVYRLGFASSRRAARQLVSHGHFFVNGRKTDIPSYLLKPGDKISLKKRSQKTVEAALEKGREIPGWLSFDHSNFVSEVLDLPKRADIPLDIREELIVELYSK